MAETSVTQALIDLHLEAADRGFGVPDLVAPPFYTLTPEFDPDDVDAPGWVGIVADPPERISLQRGLDRLWAQMGIGPGPLGSETTVQQALDDMWAAMNGDIVSITFAPQEIPAIDPLLPDEYFAVTPSSTTGLGSVTTEDTPGYSLGGVLPEEMQAIGMPPTGDFILPDLPELDPGATALVMIDTDQIHRYGTPSYFYPRLSNMAEGGLSSTGLDPFIAFFVIRGDPDPYDWDGFTLTMRQIPYNP